MKVPPALMRKAGEAVVSYKMIADGDRILIGLSGGKDSFVLAHVLHELQKKAPVHFELVCASFDPGFEGFELEKIRDYAVAQNWDFHSVKLDIAPIINEKDFEESPCALCSRLRRGHLYRLMDEHKCNKLALGHHADDAIISFLMSCFRGHGLSTMGPNVPALEDKRIIRPLILIPEDKIAAFATASALPVYGGCIYKKYLDDNGDRVFFRQILAQIEQKIPDFRSLVLKSLGKIEQNYLFDKKFIDFLKK
ncbi:MAG: tRNA 2-thiocytidine biosynthesis protein TtcA [Lentisphaeria bacterium]|nr:tRNA 2-thiocytidine biosynthesis protein TtcA [Lentisphaeria bacterium]